MSQTNTSISKIVIQSIGGGLLLMAFFTMVWAGIAFGNATGAGRYLILIVFALFSLVFVGYAIYYLSIAKRFPKLTADADKAKGKKIAKLYGITFGLEGILIPLAAGLCLYLAHAELILPVMALIIGLHFYPMAKVFNRTIDYYLATWTCLVALSTFAIIIKGVALPFSAYTFLGLGIAITTTSYGFYMIAEGSRLSKHIV